MDFSGNKEWLELFDDLIVNYFRQVELNLTNSVKAVNVETGWTSLSYMDLLQAVVRVVGQYDLDGHHTGLVQTGLSWELVLGRKASSCHVVKQFVSLHGPKRCRVDLKGNTSVNGHYG